MTSADYIAWLQDARRFAHRVLLIELDHAGGTLRLASDDWQADAAAGFAAYDGWLTESPTLENSVDDFNTVGDVTAVNAGDEDWTALQVRGRECRWLFGDRDWSLADFQRVATARIDEVRAIDGRLCRFDLSTTGSAMARLAGGSETPRTGTLQSVLQAVAQPVTPVRFVNIPGSTLSRQVSVTVSDTDTIGNVVRVLARSAGAYARFSRDGCLCLIHPSETPAVSIDADDIAGDKIETVDVVPPYASVEVDYGDDQQVTQTTGASTGLYDDTLIVDTVLVNAADAAALAATLATRYATRQPVRRLELIDMANIISAGDIISVEHDDYTGIGMVSSVVSEPLSDFSTVEVLT